jgi:hypothetical protein
MRLEAIIRAGTDPAHLRPVIEALDDRRSGHQPQKQDEIFGPSAGGSTVPPGVNWLKNVARPGRPCG